jgi:hypothetical protein
LSLVNGREFEDVSDESPSEELRHVVEVGGHPDEEEGGGGMG